MDGTRLRTDLLDLEPYDPDMRPVEVMLSANENNYGLPASVRAELARRLADEPLNRYPEATSPRVRTLLARMWGVEPAGIVVGNGGDELIFNLLLAFGGPGRALVNCPPTFSAYELYARLTQTPVVDVPRRPDFSLDEPAVLAAAQCDEAAIVVLTSPNNPSGNLGRVNFVRALAQASDALIVVDEAYGEFCAPEASCVPLVAEYPNVCVLRTLSKAYALAGARLGYVICGAQVADGLLAVRQPYSVSRLDQLAAEVVLEHRAEMQPAVEAIVAERSRLTAKLRALAAEVAIAADPGRDANPSASPAGPVASDVNAAAESVAAVAGGPAVEASSAVGVSTGHDTPVAHGFVADATTSADPAGSRIDVYDSEANFVLVRFPESEAPAGVSFGRPGSSESGVSSNGPARPELAAPVSARQLPSADEIHERLAAASVLVRNFSHAPGLRGCLRVSVGRPEETDRLIARLREILGLPPEPAPTAVHAPTSAPELAPTPEAEPASVLEPAPGAELAPESAAAPTAPTTKE